MRFLLLAAACLGAALLPPPAAAQPAADGLSPAFRTCMDKVDLGAMKNSQFLACYQAELKRQDKVLNEEYRKLVARTPAETREKLRGAARAWIAFRDGWCGYEGMLDGAPSPEVNAASCLVDMTVAHIRRLKDAAN